MERSLILWFKSEALYFCDVKMSGSLLPRFVASGASDLRHRWSQSFFNSSGSFATFGRDVPGLVFAE